MSKQIKDEFYELDKNQEYIIIKEIWPDEDFDNSTKAILSKLLVTENLDKFMINVNQLEKAILYTNVNYCPVIVEPESVENKIIVHQNCIPEFEDSELGIFVVSSDLTYQQRRERRQNYWLKADSNTTESKNITAST